MLVAICQEYVRNLGVLGDQISKGQQKVDVLHKALEKTELK